MAREYIAFISYRHLPLDMQVAARLQQLTERFVVPKAHRRAGKRHLGLVFRDKSELPLTSDLTGDIYDALDHSQFLIVVCTPATAQSAWVLREIDYFIARHGREKVLTVLADGTMAAAVPEVLTRVYGPDGVTVVDRREPLAAMITAPTRAGRMRLLRAEFPRIAAALLGCPYDDLVRRSRQRRQRLITAGLAAVAALALAFTGLVLAKNSQIAAANDRLAAALAAAQTNESLALAQTSAYALATGTRYQAITAALAALPTAENDRPLLPQAEKALADALRVYCKPALLVQSQVQADMANAVATADGSLVYVLTYEGLACYRTADGSLCWSAQVQYHRSDELRLLTNETRLMLSVAVGRDIGYHIYDAADGTLLYSSITDPLPADMSTVLQMTMTEALPFEDQLRTLVDRCETGALDDCWVQALADDRIAVVAVHGASGTVEVAVQAGDTLPNRVLTTKAFGTVTEVVDAGSRIALAAQDCVMVIDLDTFALSRYDVQHVAHIGMDGDGNVLMLTDTVLGYYWAAADDRPCVIDVCDALQEAHSYTITGTNVMFVQYDTLDTLCIAQVVGGASTTATVDELQLDNGLNGADGYSIDLLTETVTVDGSTYTITRDPAEEFICTVTDSSGPVASFHLTEAMHYANFAVDKAGGYLYVFDGWGWGTGLRIDMRSWSVVAEIPDLQEYLPETNQLVCSSGGNDWLVYPVYTLQQLQDIAAAQLAK